MFIRKEYKIHNDEVPKFIYLNKFRRLIFLVIDGLRYDFAKNFLTRTSNFSNNSMFFHTYSDPPTSTMQRIKSISTGTLPVFIEISNNFDSSHKVIIDSFIKNFSEDGNVTLIGDDTWISLFGEYIPNKYSAPSFDVFDFDSVDNKVFEYLPKILKMNDSKLIIGHFLGVDHHGHVHGLNSNETKQKIDQIDIFIEKILGSLNDDDLIMIVSDHGMTDNGSHGGASFDETSSFLYGYSPGIKYKQTINEQINQIDICPTISLLFGYPIPTTNLGSVIIDFFQNESSLAKEYSDRQIKKLLEYDKISVETKNAVNYYKTRYASFNLLAMYIGLFLMISSFLFLPFPRSILVIFHSLSLLSDSFIFGENLVVQLISGLLSNSFLSRIIGFFGNCREDADLRLCLPHISYIFPFNKGIIKIIGSKYIIPFILYIYGIYKSNKSAEFIHFFSICGFFATGHHFTLSSLNIEAGFAFGRYHNLVSPLLIFINTFICDIIANIYVKDIYNMIAYRTIDLISITAFAIYGRYHLLIWNVFAPRLLYQFILSINSLVIGIIRVHFMKIRNKK